MIKRILLGFFLLIATAQPASFAAVAIDSSDDSLDCGTGSSLTDVFDAGGTLYIRMIINTYYNAILHRAIRKNQWELRFQLTAGANQIDFTKTFSGGVANWGSTTNAPSTGVIHTIVITYNASSATNDPSFYIDGSSMALSYDNNTTGTTSSDSASKLLIGNSAVNGTRGIDGTIFEAALWNTVISSQSIANLSNAKSRVSPLQISPSNLKGFWQLHEVSDGASADAQTFFDSTSNGNSCAADNGANNTGMTGVAESQQGFP